VMLAIWLICDYPFRKSSVETVVTFSLSRGIPPPRPPATAPRAK